MKFPLKTFVAEDDQKQLDVLLKRMDYHFSPLEVAETYDSAVNIVNSKGIPPFDLSILDVVLGNSDCYNLINTCGKEKFGWLTYTTIEERGVRLGYTPTEHPYYFLIKPHCAKTVDVFLNKIKGYINKLNDRNGFSYECCFLTNNNTHLFLDSKDILYFQGLKNYAYVVYLKDGAPAKEIVKHSLGTLAQYLGDKSFNSKLKSYIYNLEHIDRLLSGDMVKGVYGLELEAVRLIQKYLHGLMPKRKEKLSSTKSGFRP